MGSLRAISDWNYMIRKVMIANFQLKQTRSGVIFSILKLGGIQSETNLNLTTGLLFNHDAIFCWQLAFILTADTRRYAQTISFPCSTSLRSVELRLGKPEQGKTACPPGKQFYFFCKIVGSRIRFNYHSDDTALDFFNREAIDGFCPVRLAAT